MLAKLDQALVSPIRRIIDSSVPPFLFLLLVTWAAGWFVRIFSLPIPTAIVGFFILLGLLFSRAVSASWLKRGGRWLMDHLMLLYVPPMLSIVEHHELLGALGSRVVLVIFIGTPLVMIGTAAVVEFSFRLQRRYVR